MAKTDLVARGKRNKRKGTRQELRTVKWLRESGYDSHRTPASKGLFDVIGIGRDELRLIQVKSNRKPGPDERGRLEAFADADRCPIYATVEIWVWKDRARYPEVWIWGDGCWEQIAETIRREAA